jgi:hypothetical protein
MLEAAYGREREGERDRGEGSETASSLWQGQCLSCDGGLKKNAISRRFHFFTFSTDRPSESMLPALSRASKSHSCPVSKGAAVADKPPIACRHFRQPSTCAAQVEVPLWHLLYQSKDLSPSLASINCPNVFAFSRLEY